MVGTCHSLMMCEAYRELLALIRAGDNSVEDLQAWLAEREA